MVYIALMIGLLSFLIIALLVTQLGGHFVTGDAEYMNLMFLALFALAAITIPAGLILFKKLLKEIDSKEELSRKIEVYRSAMFVRAAMFEATGFFSVVCVLLFGHFIFIVIAAAVMILFAMFLPTKSRIAKDLQISLEDL